MGAADPVSSPPSSRAAFRRSDNASPPRVLLGPGVAHGQPGSKQALRVAADAMPDATDALSDVAGAQACSITCPGGGLDLGMIRSRSASTGSSMALAVTTPRPNDPAT